MALTFNPWAISNVACGLLADKAMPDVHDTPAYRSRRNRDLYLAAAESALQDGVVTDKERNVLATLADRLGIFVTEALGLERRAAARGT